MIKRLSALLVSAAVLLSCGGSDRPPLTAGAGPGDADVRANNRGVALMGRFQYQEAADVFAALTAKRPDWLPVKVNLGIAVLNVQTPGSEDEALRLFAEVLAREPDNARALYCTGLLRVYKGEELEALPLFLRVTQLRPKDPHARYYLGQCTARGGDQEGALTHYLQAAELDPYLRSAYYGAFQVYQRLGKRAEAQDMITRFQELKNNPQARQVEFKYTRMGRLAEVKTADGAGAAPPKAPAGPLLADAAALPLPADTTWAPNTSLTAADIDGDGRPDLFAAGGWRRGETVRNAVYLADTAGYVPAPDHVLADVADVRAALWGDVANRGNLDVYLCRKGPNQLWRRGADGAWSLVDQAVGGGDAETVDGALVDADHDGDLDVFLVNKDAPCELLNNNLDGTWRPLAAEVGLRAVGGRAVLFADLDNDRDLDIVVLHDTPPHQVFLNDRLWRYAPAPGFEAFTKAAAATVIAGDLEADGQVELFTRDAEGRVRLWRREAGGAWAPGPLTKAAQADALAWLDLTGAGRHHLVTLGADGWGIHDPADPAVVRSEPAGGGRARFLGVVRDPARGPAMLTAAADGTLYLHAAGSGRLPFVGLSFTGAVSQDGATRSNTSGIGTRFAVRNGNTWTAAATIGGQSGPGQSLTPRAVGTGGAGSVDFLAVTWSDGVYQTEMALPAGSLTVVPETQRQLASCPVLFVWDGTRFQFISDILGVAGMGFNLGRGEYAPPRPWEHFELPADQAHTAETGLRLKIAEPMEESTYLDHADVVAYDLPAGWQMVLDERMGTGAPEPTGAPVFYRREQLPVAAEDADGADVLAAVAQADKQAVPVPRPDHRFLGLLTTEHRVTLTFDRAPNAMADTAGSPWLVIDGWLEYPYSQTCFAAWQAGLAYEPLSLDVPDGRGGWTTVMPQFGYPAGMPRRMAVPLPPEAAGAKRLRLRTNQEIYLDRVAVVWGEPDPGIAATVLPAVAADLRPEGFARRTTGDQRLPHFDDRDRLPLWDTRHQSGFYSAYGDVLPLVAQADDALMIMGPGEAATLTFAPAPPLPAGHTRRLVLRAYGWCKDMDLYTDQGDTITPLPAAGRGPAAAAAALHARHNTRYQAGP